MTPGSPAPLHTATRHLYDSAGTLFHRARPEPSQTTLIARCAAGDAAACAELVAMHERIVFNLAFRMLGDRDEALDLAQDVFLRVFRTLSSFRAEATLATWIHRIVVTQSINRQRTWRRRRRGHQVSLDAHLDAAGDIPSPSALPPDRLLARKRTAERVWRALDRLPADQRTVIVLREFDGLQYKEIACALGVDVGVVKARLARARTSLRSQLRPAHAA